MGNSVHSGPPLLVVGTSVLPAAGLIESTPQISVSPMFTAIKAAAAPLNDVLKSTVVSRYVDLPTLSDNNVEGVLGVSRASVSAGVHKLAIARKPVFENDCFLRHVFAWKKGLLMLDSSGLPSEHWTGYKARYLDEEHAWLSINGQSWVGYFEGDVVRTSVRLCESYEIWVGRDVVVVTDSPIYVAGKGVVVPQGAIDPGLAMAMVCDYEGDDGALEHDQAAFTEYVRHLRKHQTVDVFGRPTLDFSSELVADSYAALSGLATRA